MAGLYIHIPYCKQACSYCDFHFITQLKSSGQMVEAIITEMALRKDFLGSGTQLETVYLGGGTPSILSIDELNQLWEGIHTHFSLAEQPEITLEANPDDLSEDKVKAFKQLGVNRLSIGIQSFDAAELKWMNRSHTAAQAMRCVPIARDVGITNISIDLIFATPFTSLEAWQTQLDTAISLEVSHLSLYALTVERKTALNHWVKKGNVILPEEELGEAQFLAAHDRLSEVGYEHYELSNYALPGFRSRHNRNYWEGVPYLGLGPSAHSFSGSTRSANIAHNAFYIQKVQQQELPTDFQEVLDTSMRYNEYVMTQLRTKKGISLAYIQAHFHRDIQAEAGDKWAYWQEAGYMEADGDFVYLTPIGWWMSDAIIRDLFW